MRAWIPCVSLLMVSCNLELGLFISSAERDAERAARCQEALDTYCVDVDDDDFRSEEPVSTLGQLLEADEHLSFCEERAADLASAEFFAAVCPEGAPCADGQKVSVHFVPCTAPQDCDDSDGSTFPGADDCSESEATAIDNDCDGELDEDADFSTWYPDLDGDGYGDSSSAGEQIDACRAGASEGLVEDNTDCNDAPDDGGAAIYPGADEPEEGRCPDGIDQDCDGTDWGVCALEGTVSLGGLGAMQQKLVGGVAVASGDQDGDGVPDLVVVGYDGEVTVLGGDTISAPSGAGGFGSAVAVGDWDGDGVLDVAVGATDANRVVSFAGPGFASPSVMEAPTSGSVGSLLATATGGEADTLLVPARYQSPGESWTVYLVADALGATVITYGMDPSLSSFSVAPSWPLALSASSDGTRLAVGYSAVTGSALGCNLYDVSDLSLVASATTSTAASVLGASVLVADLDDSGKADLLCGAPGADTLYLLTDPASAKTVSASTAAWTGGAGTGAGVALVNDLDGDGHPELAIGAEGALYLLYGPDFGPGDLDTLADATVTGFAGPVTQLVSAGDLDGDQSNDLLVTDGTHAYILYGGPK